MTCWPPFSRQRNKASGQSLRLQWQHFAADSILRCLQNSNRRNDVRHYRLVHSWPSRLFGLSSNLAYITSAVFLSATSVLTRLVRLSNASLKNAGVEDGVEINNQRKAFLDMLAWSEGIDNGRQKTRNHGYDVIVGRKSYLLITPTPPQTCHAKPKTQFQQAPDATSFFPVAGCLPQAAWPERLLSEKSGRRGIAAEIKESVALYLWLIVVISVRQSTVAAISGLHCRALVMVSSEYKADSLIAN